MSANERCSVELKERHLQFLRDAAQKYELPDESKALRCLIDFAIASTDQHDAIFQEVRCLDC